MESASVEGKLEKFEDLRTCVSEIIGLTLSKQQEQAFLWYRSELISWNERFNLTAITEPEGIHVRHFVDSLTCLQAMNPSKADRVIDVGTGAGFPGLPIKIACPHIRLTLVEATRKKAEFCQHVVDGLGLEGVTVLHGRAEKLGHDPDHRGAYAISLARAVAPLSVLVEYLLPFTKVGGWALAQKGETAHEEAHLAGEALGILGGQVDRLIPVELPGVVETRYLVLIKKIAETPEAYPRRIGVPTKRPLGVKKGP